jgi:hypothetical protein
MWGRQMRHSLRRPPSKWLDGGNISNNFLAAMWSSTTYRVRPGAPHQRPRSAWFFSECNQAAVVAGRLQFLPWGRCSPSARSF